MEDVVQQSSTSSGSFLQRVKGWAGAFSQRHPWFRWGILKKFLTVAFFALIAYLLYSKSGEIDWPKVQETFLETKPLTLVIGVAVAVVAYLAYATYDLIGRNFFGYSVPSLRILWVGFVSYAGNLNLGAIVGSLALRYRLYHKHGLNAGEISKLISFSVAANWLAYTIILSVLVLSGQLELPESWPITTGQLSWLSVLTLALALGYIGYACLAKSKAIHIRGRKFVLPGWQTILQQMVVATTHWSLMAFAVYVFMPQELSYFQVYAVLLICSLAGAISHVPGGLGVLEATFIVFLGGVVDKNTLLAALFAYRCVFYFVPLVLAMPLFLLLEAKLKSGSSAEPGE